MKWETIRLGDIYRIKKGSKIEETSGFAKNSIRYIQIEDLRNDDNIKYCDALNAQSIAEESNIIIAWDGANAGTSSYGLKGAIGSTLAVLKTERNLYTPFVGRYVQSRFQFLRDSCTGATIPHLNRQVLENIPIPIPPIDIQVKIAETLDRASELINKRKKQIELLDQLVKSVFIDMFGDPVTNPKGWDKWRIADLAKRIQYGTSEKASTEILGYPVLRMNNITYQGNWDFSDLKYMDLKDSDKDKYLVNKGEMLFNRTNSKELVGKTAVYRNDHLMAYAGYLVKLIPNENANSEFISAFLNSLYGKKLLFSMAKNIVGMANINAKEMGNIIIYKPPIDLQNQFASIVEHVEKQKEILSSAVEKLELTYKSLMQKAFSGELFN